MAELFQALMVWNFISKNKMKLFQIPSKTEFTSLESKLFEVD